MLLLRYIIVAVICSYGKAAIFEEDFQNYEKSKINKEISKWRKMKARILIGDPGKPEEEEEEKNLQEASLITLPLRNFHIMSSSISRVRRSENSDGKTSPSLKANCESKKCSKKKLRKRGRKKRKGKGRNRKKNKKRRNRKGRKGNRKHKRTKQKIIVESPSKNTTSPPVKKGLSEECTRSSDCMEGLCCARHKFKRYCRPLLKINETCTRPEPKHRKRSSEFFELCPCEEGLMCQSADATSRSRLSKCKQKPPIT